jgi:hypothetical protein
MNDVMMVVKQNQCSIIRQDLQLFCTMTIGIPKINLEQAMIGLKEIHSLVLKKEE